MTTSKLNCVVLLSSAVFATNALAVNFVATDTATLQTTGKFSTIDLGHLVALTTPVTFAPGAYTVVAPLNLGNLVNLQVVGGPAATTTGPLTRVPLIAGEPAKFTGLTTTGQAIEITTKGNQVKPTLASPGLGLAYSNFGRWEKRPATLGATGPLVTQVFAGGTLLTPASRMPVAGSAIYTGKVGIVGTNGAGQMYEGDSNIRLAANFGTKRVTGTIAATPVTSFATQLPAGSFNALSMNGTFSGNTFVGNVVTLAKPLGANPLAVGNGVTGTTSGKFYGPTANEVTGVFAINTATVKVAGSFGAKR